MTEVLLIALIAAITAATVLCIVVLKRYKSGSFSPIYPLDRYTRLDLTAREDRFLHRHVTKVKVQSSGNNKK